MPKRRRSRKGATAQLVEPYQRFREENKDKEESFDDLPATFFGGNFEPEGDVFIRGRSVPNLEYVPFYLGINDFFDILPEVEDRPVRYLSLLSFRPPYYKQITAPPFVEKYRFRYQPDSRQEDPHIYTSHMIICSYRSSDKDSDNRFNVETIVYSSLIRSEDGAIAPVAVFRSYEYHIKTLLQYPLFAKRVYGVEPRFISVELRILGSLEILY